MAGAMDSRIDEPRALAADAILRGLALKRLVKICCFDEVDSTNRLARDLARQGAAEGTVIIAEAQTHGRGRMGRVWISPPGVNLYISFLLRPELHPTQASKLTLTAAVAVAETVASYVPFSPRIKWPNDILLRGRKTAGILCELVCEAERSLFAVVGVGINLNFSPSLMPPELRYVATSLMGALGKPVDRLDFTRTLIQKMDTWYVTLTEGGFTPIADRWRRYARLEGRRIRVTQVDATFTAKAMDLDIDGALIVQTDDGTARRIVAGDIAFVDQN